jgi:hypothetical protein
MTSSPPKILSISVIGKHNQPLFVRSFDSRRRGSHAEEEDLKWHYVAHTSLDVFEERGNIKRAYLLKYASKLNMEGTEAQATKVLDSYYGLLYTMDDYAVLVSLSLFSPCFSYRPRMFARRYGYQTNTQIKFVLALALTDVLVKDMDVKTVRVLERGRERSRCSFSTQPETSKSEQSLLSLDLSGNSQRLYRLRFQPVLGLFQRQRLRAHSAHPERQIRKGHRSDRPRERYRLKLPALSMQRSFPSTEF